MEKAQQHRLADLLDELQVRRHAGVGVEPEDEHGSPSCFTSTVVKQEVGGQESRRARTTAVPDPGARLPRPSAGTRASGRGGDSDNGPAMDAMRRLAACTAAGARIGMAVLGGGERCSIPRATGPSGKGASGANARRAEQARSHRVTHPLRALLAGP
ncbi:hypothetical protein GCM10027452_17140 [Micromonospora halotolerans]